MILSFVRRYEKNDVALANNDKDGNGLQYEQTWKLDLVATVVHGKLNNNVFDFG